MTQKNRTPSRSSVIDADTGSGAGQVAAHRRDSGSQANETVDGLDATTESLRHAAPAISKKCPYLTGLAKHRESGLVVDKTEAVTRALTFTGTAPPTKTRRQQERSTTGTGSMTEKRKPGARESFQTGNKTLVSSIGDNWALRKEVPMPIAPQDLIERARMFEERAERRATQFPTALRRNGRSLSSAVRRASGNKAGTRIGALRETGASLVPIFGNGSV